MKTLGTISLAVFLFLLTAPVGTYSQDRDDSRPNQTQEEKDKAKNNEHDKQEDNAAKQEQKREHGQSGLQQEDRQDKDVARRQEKQEQKEQRSGRGMEPDRHQNPAAANQGMHMPDNKFRAPFGRQHTFRVQRTEVVNVAQPVIVYGGYSFQLVEAWPADWGFNDNCYIDYVDGEYFLFDVLHPSIRIAVFVVG